MTDDAAISYQAATRGTPVLSSTGNQIGTLEHVLEVPEVDVFDGIVITTKDGLRFIDADYVQRITRSYIRCSLDDAQARQLPPPDGAPVYRVDAHHGHVGRQHPVNFLVVRAGTNAQLLSHEPGLAHPHG